MSRRSSRLNPGAAQQSQSDPPQQDQPPAPTGGGRGQSRGGRRTSTRDEVGTTGQSQPQAQAVVQYQRTTTLRPAPTRGGRGGRRGRGGSRRSAGAGRQAQVQVAIESPAPREAHTEEPQDSEEIEGEAHPAASSVSDFHRLVEVGTCQPVCANHGGCHHRIVRIPPPSPSSNSSRASGTTPSSRTSCHHRTNIYPKGT